MVVARAIPLGGEDDSLTGHNFDFISHRFRLGLRSLLLKAA